MLSHSVVSDFLWPPWPVATRLLCPWNSPSKNTGVGCHSLLHFPEGTVVKKKNLPANWGDAIDGGLILVLGRSPGVGNGNPLQYYCWDNSMDRGTWRATVHGITKNWTHTCTQTIALRTHKEKLYPPLSSVTDTSELMELFFDEGLGMMVDNMKTPGPPRG